jgi:hypothetical protein
MLIGLLRLRRYGVGTFGLGQLLWRQVGIPVGAVAFHSLMHSPFPRVSFGSSLLPSPRLRQWYVQGLLQPFIFLITARYRFYLLESERYLSPPDLSMMSWC